MYRRLLCYGRELLINRQKAELRTLLAKWFTNLLGDIDIKKLTKNLIMKALKERFKELLKEQRINTINLIESSTGDMFILDIELSTGDKVLFGDDEKGVKVSIKWARDIELEDIEQQLSQLERGQRKEFTLKYNDPDKLRGLAKNRAEKIGHPDPLNVVNVNGRRCVVDFNVNVY